MLKFIGCSVMSVAMAAAVLPSAAGAAQIEERSIKFGYSVPAAHPIGKGADKFLELVTKKSDGKIKMKVYPNTQLGSETQMISAAQGGVQEIGAASSAPLVGLVKEFAIFDLPFLFANEKQVDAVADGEVGNTLFAKLSEKGLVGLCYWENGFRNVTNNKRPINTVADISGLKIRTMQNPVYIDSFSTLGANAVPMPWPEVYTALETHAIDAQENPFGIIYANNLQEVQKYLSVTKHAYSPYVIFASKKFWDKLSPDEQAIFKDSCTEARDFQRAFSRSEDARILTDLKAKGMQVNEVSPAEVVKIKAMLKPVIDKYTPNIGDALLQKAQTAIQATN